MKFNYLWILVVWMLIQIPVKANQFDSLRQVLTATPDSLQAEPLVELGLVFWNKRADDSTYLDSMLKYGELGYETAVQAKDTNSIKRGLSQMYSFYFDKKLTKESDSLLKLYRVYLAEFGLQLPSTFDNFNEEAGYSYAHLFNTLKIYDATGENLSFETIVSPTFQDSFYANNSSLDKIKPESEFWIKLKMRGDPERANDYLFMVGYDSYSWGYADIYMPDVKGEYHKYTSGNKIDPEDKPVNDWRNFFDIYIPKGEVRTVYIKVSDPVQAQRTGYIFVRYMDRESIIENEKSSALTRGIFHGVVSIQAIYFFLLFLSTRVRSYKYYVIYILGFGLFIVNAHYFNFFFPHHGYYRVIGFYIAVAIIGYGLIRFTEAFLDTKEILPRWRYSGNIYLAIFYFILLVSMIFRTWEVPWLNEENTGFWSTVTDNTLDTFILVCILGLGMVLTWGVLAYKRGHQSARFFLIALIFFAAGFTIPGISKVFNINFGWITFNRAMLSVQGGIILQLSFFALGVGYKRKQLELERQTVLREVNDKLLKADKMKDEFLANTSHELRTPLNGIIGIAESLSEGVAGTPTAEMKKNLDLVVNSGRRLSGLVNDLLDFSKLRSHELDLNLKPIDIESLVQLVVTLSLPLINEDDIKLINRIPKGLKPVSGDENRLQQIMFNLVGNAIKFTDSGEIIIEAEEKDNNIIVKIKDTGIGIPQEKHEEIFKSFEQADGSTSREYGGTGLGLSITRQLVELHGGKIWLESEEQKGSTFYFSIPISSEAISENRGANLTSKLITKRIAIPKSVIHPDEFINGTVKILVVDDEPINHQVLNNHLSDEHYSITPAMNGEEALEILDSGKMFDLVLLDLMMPRMSGYEVCQKIRKKYLASELPVIMITAKNQVSDLVEGLNLGANDYISKPFSRQEFLARIKTHLNLFNINSAYGRFVPHEFLHSLGHEFITEVKLGDQVEKKVTVFFSDIRAYTTLSEQMTPKENFDFLNAYLGRVGPVIKKNLGFVGQYIGDGIMALFQSRADDGLNAAIQIQEAIKGYNQERDKLDRIPIKLGIGLHTGQLMMGIIGDKDRMDAGVVSDTVNTASRMEGLTKHFGVSILISESVVGNFENREDFNLRYLGKVQVKGRSEPLDVFDCFDGDDDEIRDLKTKSVADFESGMKAYFNKDFKVAAEAFKKVIGVNPSDKAARMYLSKIELLIEAPIPMDWTGVETMMYK